MLARWGVLFSCDIPVLALHNNKCIYQQTDLENRLRFLVYLDLFILPQAVNQHEWLEHLLWPNSGITSRQRSWNQRVSCLQVWILIPICRMDDALHSNHKTLSIFKCKWRGLTLPYGWQVSFFDLLKFNRT